MTATATVTEMMLQFVADKLTDALTGVRVERFRLRPYEANELPAVRIRPAEEETDYGPGPWHVARAAARELFFDVEARTTGDPADVELDSLRSNIVLVVMKDRTVGGNATGIGEQSTRWEAEAASDATFGVVIIRFKVAYKTRADDARAKL
jgi:hypothetical protein